ncbi:dockerin type I domain-containing protein [Novipirellula sp. SH528]|uniref:dockerin type I domain-containing protein n=1 Tax=Novipirellula sp. SH528 TaxID=3454466 RepID=UPI003FA0667A
MMTKRPSRTKSRKKRNRRHVLKLEQLEDRRLLTLPPQLNFTVGDDHFIRLDNVQQDVNNDCIININERVLAPQSYKIEGTIKGQSADATPHDLLIQLRQSSDLTPVSSLTAANLVNSGDNQTFTFEFSLPADKLKESGNSFHVFLSRPGVFEVSNTLGFTLTLDTTRPTATIDTEIGERRNTPVDQVEVTLSEKIQNTTFTRDDITLTRGGGSNLITNAVNVSLKSGTTKTFVVSGLGGLTNVDGDYSLTVNSTGVTDLAGNSGSGSANKQWELDTSPPTATDPPRLSSNDDSGRYNNDAITNENRDLTFTSVVRGALEVKFQIRNNSGTVVTEAPGTLSGINTYEATFPDTLIDGSYKVVVVSTDNLHPAITSPELTLQIDTSSPVAPTLSAGSQGPVVAASPSEIVVSNTEINAEVTLSRENAGVIQIKTPAAGQTVSALSDDPVVANNGETFQYTAVQSDIAGNTSGSSAPYIAVVDPISPTLSKFAFATADNALPNSALPVPMTRSTRPLLEVQLVDQRYAQLINTVVVSLFVNDDLVNPIGAGVATFDSQASTLVGANINATKKVQVTLLPGVEFDPGKQYDLTFVATDSAGKTGRLVKQIFVLPESNATQNAPSTPVFTESFFIGASVLEVRPSQKQIVVDQQIPTGYAINIAAATTPIRVASSVTEDATQRTTLTLDLDTTATLDKVNINDKVAWLRPWQMSFDKTTQTVWFTMEDGHHLGQFDPATGSVEIHDVSIPVIRESDGVLVRTAFDPHGVFFDFNTHLTPRVWFVYRNQVEGNNGGPSIDDAPEDAVNSEILRVSYYDVAQRKLFTFDFKDTAGQFELEAHHDDTTTSIGGIGNGGGTGNGAASGGTTQAESEATDEAVPLKVGHAVFVDTKGSVWITAEDSGTVVELNFDNPTSGNGPATLNTQSAIATAHVIPKEFGSDTKISTDFHVHGVQSIVDERNGSTYVWMLNGDVKGGESTQRLALLIPGETDQWYQFAIKRSVPDSAAHLLFTAFDDNETPGIPEDDRLVFTDSGFNFRTSGDGIVATMNVGEIIRAVQEGRDVTQISPKVRSIQIQKIPGAVANSTFSGPNQTFVDRSGTTFVIDPQGGVARLNLDEFNESQLFTADAMVSHESQTPQHTRIMLDEATTTSTFLKAKVDGLPGTDPARSLDRSQMDGVDQYEVAAEALRRGNGEGPFRGALNAANTLYGSLAQSDHLSTTIFAESARRQMSVATKPETPEFATPAGVISEARMAFQVLRNGSLVLTARGDGMIADEQINLLAEMVNKNRITETEAAELLITGEASAMTTLDGSVRVMGRSTQGGVVQYTFTPAGTDWDHKDIFEMANWQVTPYHIDDHILAEDPVPAGKLGFAVTTAAGHLLALPIDNPKEFRDLTMQSGQPIAGRVYSATSTIELDGKTYVYGTNQTGSLIEYSVTESGTTVHKIENINPETSNIDRDIRMMRNVRALVIAGTRHIFATDGTSRLVHWTLDANGNIATAENISQITADSSPTKNDGANYGYFPFQKPFTGRVYTYVAPLVEDDGTIRVYGTNGGDLIEFTLPPGGQWRVANLTNDTNGTYGADGPGYRVPANAVFGGPTAYMDSNGGRHILQINAEGEVVEYFTYGDKLFPNTTDADRINSQNVNFFSGKSTTALSTELPATIVKSVALTSVAPATTPLETTPTPTVSETTPTPTETPTPAPTPTTQIAAAEDVNQDGVVTAQDALLIINYLPRTVGGGASGEQTANSPYNLDVNGDTQVTALDALRVINYLNKASSQGQSESTALDLVDDDSRSWQSEVDGVMGDIEESQLF